MATLKRGWVALKRIVPKTFHNISNPQEKRVTVLEVIVFVTVGLALHYPLSFPV